MTKIDTVKMWLKRAKSNLLLSKQTDLDDVFLEDLCFNAQQCVEKSLKALCIFYDIKFQNLIIFHI